MIKELPMLDEINAIRRLITKPMKKPKEAKAAFLQYMKDKHGVSDMESPDGQEFLKQFEKWPAMQNILDYMERES